MEEKKHWQFWFRGMIIEGSIGIIIGVLVSEPGIGLLGAVILGLIGALIGWVMDKRKSKLLARPNSKI